MSSKYIAVFSNSQLENILVKNTTELKLVFSDNEPTIGVIPYYEKPIYRFLNGSGEIKIGSENGPAVTLWEFLIHAKDSDYPLQIDGYLYRKFDLLFHAASLIVDFPDVVEQWVGENGRKAIFKMCIESGLNPADMG